MNAQQASGLEPIDFAVLAVERRRDERRPCEPTPARIIIEGDLSAIGAHVVNVSKSGLGMRLDRRLLPDTRATVEMNANRVTGSVRWCVKNRGGGWFDLGFQIDRAV